MMDSEALHILERVEKEALAKNLLTLKEQRGWFWALIVICDDKGQPGRVECRHVMASDMPGESLRDVVRLVEERNNKLPGRYMLRVVVTDPSSLGYKDVVPLPGQRTN